ncbi:MAG: hypothetical protein GWN07_31175, partial [Actinobacteria bacterium]|nr:hypothetical protein [Actinomycetota bacterium]
MFTLRMLPARHGDALWIEYGDRPHRILIDGGPSSRTTTGHLRDLLSTAEDTGLDLLVVTHIDAD